MAEGQLLFTLDYERFNAIRQQGNLFNLRDEFETRNLSLSHSLIIFKGATTDRWLLIDFEKMSWVWLVVSGLLAVGFGIIFWKLLTDIGSLASQENQLSMILSNLFAKGFYLSLIFLFLNRTIKNFAAEKHLEVTNIHRQNALETFDTFVAAAEGNRETRDAVLLAATKAIFDANQSGYLSTKTSSSDSASPVQQIIKEVIPTKSSGKDD